MVTGEDIKLASGLLPKQAVRYLESKNVQVTAGWRELRAEQHARAATVANVSKADVVSDIYAELARTLRNGGTVEQFKDQLIPRLKAKGWWQRDATTEQLKAAGRVDAQGVIAKGLTPSRLKTIYATNMQSAYMAGRYRQMMSVAEERPYWQYVAILDNRTRPAHRALDGKIFRYDDAAWGAFFPPNGFRCRCRVRNFSQTEVDKRKMPVSSSEGKLSQVDVPQRDGSTMQVTRYTDKSLPGGHFQPDAGFNSNPGLRMPRLDARAIKDPITPQPKVKKAIAEVPGQPNWKTLNLPELRQVKPLMAQAPALLPRAATAVAAEAVIAKELGLDTQAWREVETPVGNVILRAEYLSHLVLKEADGRERFAKFIMPTLTDPYEVWLTMYDDGRPRQRYIGLYKGEKYDVLVIVRQNADGSIFWNMMPAEAKKLNQQRVGKLLWGK